MKNSANILEQWRFCSCVRLRRFPGILTSRECEQYSDEIEWIRIMNLLTVAAHVTRKTECCPTIRFRSTPSTGCLDSCLSFLTRPYTSR